ncbi:MAG TPA: hypothetical protein VMR81_02850 [Patescibacteria group bacterium]|nr:hypothetical protein [Patescibacteria group bacterium]
MKKNFSGPPIFLRLFLFLSCVFIMSVLVSLPYFLVQQDLRQSANDPQIQMAEDLARHLSKGQAVSAISFPESVNMSEDLGVFVSIYDGKGQSVASTAYLNGQLPNVPLGVLLYAKEHGQNRITWQPQVGARAAIVVTPYQNGTSYGYVVVGRSLREVEKREDQIFSIVSLIWIGLFCLISVLFFFLPKSTVKSR